MRAPNGLAAVLILAGVMLGGPGLASAAETETLVVRPGTANEVISQTVFRQGAPYEVKVTGSITFPSGDTQNPGSCHADALYTICSPEENFREDTGGEGILVRRVSGDGSAGKLPEFASGSRPHYASSHAYTFVIDKAQGHLGFSGYPFRGSCPNGCNGSITVEITPPDDETTLVGTTSSVVGEVTVQRGGKGDFVPLARGAELRKGDVVRTAIEGEVLFKFPDGTTMLVKEMSEVRMSDLSSSAQRQTIHVSLKIGEVAAKINPAKAVQCDFRIQTPGSTTSSRGTKFSVFYDPVAKASLTSVTESKVVVRAGRKKLSLGAGREVEIVRGKLGRPAGLGKAGARGGVNRATATARVLTRIGKSTCRISLPRANPVGTASAKGGWKVTVKLEGAVKGASVWTVKGAKVKPANKLARRVASNCH